MNRLTNKCSQDGYEDVALQDGVTVGTAICKLADYEDTGLEPEDILSPVEMAGMACALQKLKKYEALGTVEELTALNQPKPNPPLTLEQLREMVGEWVWVVINYEFGGRWTGWAFIPTPSCIAYLDQIIQMRLCGEKFVAYRRKPEEGET